MQTVSLVLGSGGARGLVHIGVISVLEERGFRIRYISGASMGALIGGIYAAGKLDTYEHWVSALQRADVIRLLDFSFSAGGLFKGRRIIDVLRDLIGDRNIEDLPIGFTAVATAIKEKKEVWLNDGPLFDAIRASIAMPMMFTPYEYQGKQLMDGSLVNPVPIGPTLNDDTDLTIAVTLNGRPDPRLAKPNSKNRKPNLENAYSRRIARFMETLDRIGDARRERGMGFFEVFAGAMDTMQTTIGRLKMAAYAPDIVIEIPNNLGTFFEFYRAQELIAYGRQKTMEVLDRADFEEMGSSISIDSGEPSRRNAESN